ncbi:MAG: hypothetical protein A2534_04220 [Candidatus Magasanikbacteria bacterium RIFOXYD2_FULL_39_9]|uniref:HTH luxR-type domain-containing protein n=1 Tax=Candidatus Magasanikbacteria bacterium RIFOXYD1_FULL_40_23 TaxID=1798705 RepID=A0A1F6PB53_9BACT|nr:MAG: hypothetical protein A2534_04220 [Candidatus Magasanikbacteria bacterium RIFOXYD2_FULL_39_9]OGH93396.1 MAG: hypothetical protein A2563_02190 [Candidatus Magasanikbacteria bacterium RIFOXYD1_FULL_40_23]
MSETKFTPPEAQAKPKTEKEDLLKRLLSPEIKKLILSIAYKYSVKPSDAEDVVQTVLFNAYRAISEGRFDEKDAKLTSWLHTITKNECINLFRKENRLSKNDLTAVEFDDNRVEGHLPTSVDHIENKEKDEALQGLLRKLKPKQQAVMELYLQGYSQKEIGEKLDMPTNTVGVQTHYAKKRMLELLEEEK